MNKAAEISERILVLTPTGNDAGNAAHVMQQAGLTALICHNTQELSSKFLEGAGALLVAEEAFTAENTACLVEAISSQPHWSDIPLLIITSASDTAQAGQYLLNFFSPHGNVTLIERPVRPISLLSTLQVALRARRRQYQLRDFLEEQEATKARLQIAMEAGQLGHWDLDLVTGKATRSLKHDQIFGYKTLVPEWSFQTFLQHVLAEDRPLVDASFQKGLISGVWDFECRINRVDGRLAWIWAGGHSLRDGDGKPVRAVGVVSDITERKEAETELRKSEERLRLMADSIPHKIFTAKPNGDIDYYNQQWMEFSGLTFEQLKDWGWIQFMHPDDVDKNICLWKRAIERGEPIQLEHRFRRKDGVYRWHRSQTNPMRDADGKVLMWIGSNTDIEDHKRAEEKLEKTVAERTAKLQETISELEAFSYSVSHDLRAPLRAMQGYSQFLLEDYAHKLDETGQDYIRRVVKAAERLDRLIQDILTYSRVARRDIETKPVNLEKLIHEVIQGYPALQPPKVEIEIKGPLHEVMGHEGSVTQCISNLLGNAVKFVPEKRKPKITIYTKALNEHVRVYFQDNGIGIAPEHQNRIFDMFEQAHFSPDYEGTGIGLSIVRKATERMGGEVGVQSELGKGSTFWMELPKA